MTSHASCPNCPEACRCDCERNIINCKDAFLTEVPRIVDTFDMINLCNLAFNRIKRIEDGAFVNISSLSSLVLSNNAISVIRPLAFKGLANLMSLNVDYNRITDVSPVLYGLPSLARLYLNSNGIESIANDGSASWNTLTFLDLSNNYFLGLSNIPVLVRNIRAVDGGLRFFDLQNAKFASAFREVILNNNHIRALPDLRKMTSLIALALKNNPVIRIEPVLPASLTHFSLANGIISTIHPNFTSWKIRLLDIAGNRIHYLTDVLKFGTLSNYIFLSHNLIKDATLTSVMHSVHVLDLSYNKLKGRFVYDSSKLPHLQRLFLKGNSITEVRVLHDTEFNAPVNGSRGYSKLISLDVAENAISDLYFLRYFPNMISLSAYDNNLVAFERNCTGFELKYLTDVFLQGNRITSIECFKNFPKLAVLDLSDNRISKVDPSAFSGSPAIRSLNLAGNALMEFPLFPAVDSVDSIDLGRNDIEHVSSAIFVVYPRLRWLDLSFNELQTVHITSKSSLKHLNLGGNNLKINNENILLKNMSDMDNLILNGNQLTAIDNSFIEVMFGKDKIYFGLDVSDNSLTEVTNFVPYVSIENDGLQMNLKAGGNKIRTIPPYFLDEYNSDVDLSRNVLYAVTEKQCSIPIDICALDNVIDMSNNKLYYISHIAFKDCLCVLLMNVSNNPLVDGMWIPIMTFVIELDVSATGLELEFPLNKMNIAVLQMNAMTRLYNFTHAFKIVDEPKRHYKMQLQRNDMEFFPVLTSRYVDFIDVSFNLIRLIGSNSLQFLWSLKVLVLHHNKLKSIPSLCFASCLYISRIDLSENSIQFISESAFDGLGSYITINLADNRLMWVSPKSLPTFSYALDMRRNPWHCDLGLEDLRQWLIRSNLDPVECHTPLGLSGKRLIDLDESELNIQKNNSNSVSGTKYNKCPDMSNPTQTPNCVTTNDSLNRAVLQLSNRILTTTLVFIRFVA